MVGLRAKYLLVAAFGIPFSIDIQPDHVLKKLTFDLLTHPSRVRGNGEICRQNICYHVAAFRDSI